ncbi:MAG TPA: right-handed parallel beta-helix repeat-containing protein, partial [Sediminibacterium sp.]|nr:right-handed parallel beta-helix repeat-containing protein [Sediminibacterium sp.]
MKIRHSVTITPGIYPLDAPEDSAIISIAGENIVVDFNQAVLQGSPAIQRPDEFRGFAIRVTKGSHNIQIKNAFVHGFAVAIIADSVTALSIHDCNLGYNKRQHLNSHLQKEDISDWMSFHHNEKDEWLRYGAAIYLKNCSKANIHDNTVTGGQCALLMSRCTNGDIYDNNFSFNSGLGIGLYRSSGNRVYHNRLDYNVRGYYDGQYYRGQDSAGILVFEQSSDNSFVYNSVTHSGDGFFLWAGQQTLDSGEGGCNDNFIYGNDFSDAPTNGIEVTFSRNLIMKNTIRNCWHGVWGGYSYDTDITDNTFSRNEIGIAIEHGQGINIALNSFTDDKTAIKLWSRAQQPSDWVYARKKNTESRNYWIAANRFTGTPIAMDIMGTDTIALSGNTMFMVGQAVKTGPRVEEVDSSRENDPLEMEYEPDPRLKTIPAKSLPVTGLALGRNHIRITEWGPYNFAYPLLWLKAIDTSGNYHYEILGPEGHWQVKSIAGFRILEKGGEEFPSTLILQPDRSVAE